MRAWFFVLLWMAVIFYFSHQAGSVSVNTSSALLDLLVSYLPFLESDISHLLLRKLAHFTAYFILGLFLFNAITKRKTIYTLLIGSLYALSDEIHQYFIPGRACSLVDVLIDSLGILAAIISINYLKKRLSAN